MAARSLRERVCLIWRCDASFNQETATAMTSDSNGDDERVFALLDNYVGQLQQGVSADRRRILDQHPELAPALECLEALDSLAPLAPPAGAASESPRTGEFGPSAATVDFTSHGELVESSAAHAATPAAGLFGDYELLGEIGRGGMGVVYRARQQSLDRVVALKMILASHLASQDQVRRFQSEAKAAAGLRHPHIVRVFEVGQVHGQHYFSMEYVEGQSLATAIALRSLDLETSLRALGGVARAVEHLHQHGILHRDLKPANILIDAAGRPFVTDFGLAKMFLADSRSTATGMIAGTPSYMAPEQAAGRNAEIGPAADVYSLGAILYELLTGRPPFQEANPLDTLLQVLERAPVPPREIDPTIPCELELICLRCLEKSPSERYPSAAALADELERYQAGEELMVQPPSPMQRLWRWAQREAALSVRVAAVALFYIVESCNYVRLGAVEARFHWTVTIIAATWIAGSVLFHRLLKAPRWTLTARFGWAALDVAEFTATLLAAGVARSPALIVYGLLVVLSSLWLERRMVWWTTALAAAGYLVVVADAHFIRPEIYAPDLPTWPGHIYFLTALFVLGAVMSFQVSRFRALSRYYERWRMQG
jgi:eukaryotic-like serine/threonine-protein kinase